MPKNNSQRERIAVSMRSLAWRVFYSSAGHRENAWNRKQVQTMYLEALKWVMGPTQGDAPPRPKPR